MNEQIINVGRIIPIYEGTHDSARSYTRLSTVVSSGSSYISKKDVPVGIQIDNTEYWSLASDYNAKMKELENRINALSSLPEGSTANDAALADIAVGVDGTIYKDNAGNISPGIAVREQISNCIAHSDVATIEEVKQYLSTN